MERLVPLAGILVLLGIGYAFSTDRRRIPWRVVLLGTFLQAYLALFLVRPEWVRAATVATSAACFLALVAPRLLARLPEGMPEFARLVAVTMGLIGAAIALVESCRALGHAPATGVLLASTAGLLLLARLRPAVRPALLAGAALGGLLAVPAMLFGATLGDDYVFRALAGIGRGVSFVVEFAGEGTGFVFGGLVRDAASPFVFAIDVGAIILLFSSLMSVLYYVGLLPRIVGFMGRLFHRGLGVSGAEALATAANIFVGQTEAPLLVRPYLARMTASEIMALMTGGFATIAGSVFGAYVLFLEQAGIERGAVDLIAASVMSAPAAFVLAKLFVPETEVAETRAGAEASRERLGASFLDALAGGVTAGVRLAVNVAAMLLVFYALIRMLDAGVEFAARTLGAGEDVEFKDLYAYPFAPFAFLMGVPARESLAVGELLGTKTIFNEFFAYKDLRDMVLAGRISARSAMLATYALCGFANFMSIGIQIGGLSALAEGRRQDFARIALRAMVAGALACQLTACIVAVVGGP